MRDRRYLYVPSVVPALAALMLAGALPASRVTVHAAGQPAAAGDSFDREQTDRDTRVLTLGAAGALELRNISGNITVTSGPGTDARVEIVRHVRAATDDDARTGLARVTVGVEQQGDRARLAVQYPDHDGRSRYSVDVTFTVIAPAGTRVTANTISGDIRVEHIKGELSVATTSGTVAVVDAGAAIDAHSISGGVSVADETTNDAVTLTTVSGDVRLDRVAARSIQAESTSGDVIASGITADRVGLRSLSGRVSYAGTLARGGRYELQSHSGDVTFVPAGAVGYDLQASTFSGSITPGSGVAIKTISAGSRSTSSAHGTVGDGSASVTLTAFSGDITIGTR